MCLLNYRKYSQIHVREAHAQGITTAHTSTQRVNKVLCSALTLMYHKNITVLLTTMLKCALNYEINIMSKNWRISKLLLQTSSS